MEEEKFTKPGKSSVMFGKSWCDVGFLGSQVLGQALMESCEGEEEHLMKVGTGGEEEHVLGVGAGGEVGAEGKYVTGV